MIDAIDFFVPLARSNDDRGSDYRVVMDWLAAIKREYRIRTICWRDGFWVHTSLPRLIYGNNRVGVKSYLVPESIALLEQIFETDLSLCQIRRIEVGATFRVKHYPSLYLSEWARLPRMQRDTINDSQTVYFRNNTWAIYGYDKDAEEGIKSSANGYSPRIEYRRKKLLAQLFNGETLTVQDLTRPEVVGRLATIWARAYSNIEKNSSGTVLKIPKAPSILKEELAAHGLRSCGAEKILSSIACAARTKDIDQKRASRMRSLVAGLCRHSSQDPLSLSSEIDSLVLEQAREAGGSVEEILALRNIIQPCPS